MQDDAPVRNSPDAGFGAVEQLAAAATITQVVEEIANVVLSTQPETFVDQAQGNAPTGSVTIAEDAQAPAKAPCVVQSQVESAQSTMEEPVETEAAVGVEAQAGDDQVTTQEFSSNVDVEDVAAKRAYWDFTPPSCSLGLDFGLTPPALDITTTAAVPAAVPAPAPVVLSTTQAPVVDPADNNAPQEPATASPIDQTTAAPQDLKNARDNLVDAKPVSCS